MPRLGGFTMVDTLTRCRLGEGREGGGCNEARTTSGVKDRGSHSKGITITEVPGIFG